MYISLRKDRDECSKRNISTAKLDNDSKWYTKSAATGSMCWNQLFASEKGL